MREGDKRGDIQPRSSRVECCCCAMMQRLGQKNRVGENVSGKTKEKEKKKKSKNQDH